MRADPLLVETVERMFAENLAPEDLAEAHRGGGARFMALAREMGLDAVLVPQEEGGYGGGWPDAFVIAEACGRYAAPGALPEAMIRRAPGAGGEDAGDGPSPLPMPAGALLRSAQMAGAAQGLTERTAAYCSERRQFGRPIGKFQAVQQQMAELAGYAACMQAASQQAFAAVQKHGMPESGESPAWLAIAIAKCRCSELVHRVTRIAHGVHGAIGFTEEMGLQYFSVPLWRWRAEYGRDTDWARAIGTRAIASGPSPTWAALTG